MPKRTHGQSRTKEYRAYVRMLHRCHNPDYPDYPRYGGRGITVCQRWRESFLNFYADLGAAPTPAHTLERSRNNEGYQPDNVRWATRIEQNNNRSNNRLLQVGARTLTLSEAAHAAGVNVKTVWSRLQRGASVNDALKKAA